MYITSNLMHMSRLVCPYFQSARTNENSREKLAENFAGARPMGRRLPSLLFLFFGGEKGSRNSILDRILSTVAGVVTKSPCRSRGWCTGRAIRAVRINQSVICSKYAYGSKMEGEK
jgi:hypothetical protein